MNRLANGYDHSPPFSRVETGGRSRIPPHPRGEPGGMGSHSTTPTRGTRWDGITFHPLPRGEPGGMGSHSTNPTRGTWWDGITFHHSHMRGAVGWNRIPPLSCVETGGMESHSTTLMRGNRWDGITFHHFHVGRSVGCDHRHRHPAVSIGNVGNAAAPSAACRRCSYRTTPGACCDRGTDANSLRRRTGADASAARS